MGRFFLGLFRTSLFFLADIFTLGSVVPREKVKL
jgi:hypothetical protein